MDVQKSCFGGVMFAEGRLVRIDSRIAVSLNAPPPATARHNNEPMCLPGCKERHGRLGTIYTRLNTAVLMCGTLVIPAIIIAGITAVIVTILTRAARRREGMQMDGQVTRQGW